MRKYLLIFIIVYLSLTCNNNADKTPSTPTEDSAAKVEKIDTVTALENRQEDALMFKSPNGRLYKMTLVEGAEDSGVSSKAALNCDDDDFSGTDRRVAKTSISSGSIQTVSFDDFLNGLPDDDEMVDMNISKDENSNRVKAEKKNVRLENVFLYAIKRESDNDFHMIIGNESGTEFFNVENSGLPESSASAFQKLKTVREAIEDFFGGELCSNKYRKFDPAIPVTVEGSLFFDVDHKKGTVGPEGLKPKTAWEVHPITKIVFE